MKTKHRRIPGQLTLFPLEEESVTVPDTMIEEVVRTLGDLIAEAAGLKTECGGDPDEREDNE